MKKIIFAVMSVLMAVSAYAQENPEKSTTLYIIDGVVSSSAAAAELSDSDVKSMEVVKNIDKAVIITTKSGRIIAGRTIDKEGNPVPGVVVQVFESKVGTVSDMDGNYRITLPAGKTHLVFSYVDVPSRTIAADRADNASIIVDADEEWVQAVKTIRLEKSVDADEKASTAGDPLFIVKEASGKVYKTESLDSINPDQIKTINVYKNRKSMDQFKEYGDTSNGVIFVELK